MRIVARLLALAVSLSVILTSGLPAQAHAVLVSSDPADGAVLEWRIDAGLAARLGPHAFTFHRRFPDRALGPRDVAAFALLGMYVPYPPRLSAQGRSSI